MLCNITNIAISMGQLIQRYENRLCHKMRSSLLQFFAMNNYVHAETRTCEKGTLCTLGEGRYFRTKRLKQPWMMVGLMFIIIIIMNSRLCNKK